LVGSSANGCWLALTAAAERRAFTQRSSLLPGRLDQKPSGMAIAGLVIVPSRRCSPLECSLGTRPRNAPSACGRKRVQSPSSTVNASAVNVETPRKQQSRPTISANGGSPASSAIA
jgi:hypothetical protein